MERINLSQNEKVALRTLNGCHIDDTFFKDFAGAVDSLQQKGLVQAFGEEGHELIDARISSFGRLYINENPKLHNKTNWVVISAIAGLISATAAIAALFIACNMILFN